MPVVRNHKFRVLFVYNPTGDWNGRRLSKEYRFTAKSSISAKKVAYAAAERLYPDSLIKFVMYWPPSKTASVVVPWEYEGKMTFPVQFQTKIKGSISDGFHGYAKQMMNSGGE